MKLFFDTETTGLPDKRAELHSASQPHLVQMALELTENDGSPVHSVSMIIDPGVEIPKGASDIHGITTEKARGVGFKPSTAVAIFNHLAQRATEFVAHNIEFDAKIMTIAGLRNGFNFRGCFEGNDAVSCTMLQAAPIVNLPPTERMLQYGFNGPKNPTLGEAYSFLFGEELVGAHDALIDVRACKRIYFELNKTGAQ